MKVAYRIVADGTDVTGNFQDRLTGLTITDEAGQKSDTAEITVDDRDYRVALPETGATLVISLGFERRLVEIGRYVVDDLSGEIAPASITITAKAADMAGGIRARKTRAWHEVTVGDIVEKIAGEHGLTPRVGDSLKQAFYPYLAQTSESDLNVLTRLASDLDAVAKPAGGHLVLARRGEGRAADGTELPVFVVHRSQIAGGNWKVTARGRYGRVTAEYADRDAAEVKKITVGEEEPELKLRHRYASEDEARRAAKATLARGKRASGTISIELGGFRGELIAEAKVNLQGIKPELAGEWLITRVQHRLSDTLTTSFDAERDNEEAGGEGEDKGGEEDET